VSTLEQQLSELSAREMVAAAGLARAPAWLRGGLGVALGALSRPLGRTLARFDSDIALRGLPVAASRALASFGAGLRVEGAAASAGPLLVVANHPGAYDGLALMAALGRTDLRVLAAGRGFLEALPNLAERHLVLLPDTPGGRLAALRRALAHVRDGGALLQFGAGAIEPDPAFANGEPLLGPWPAGTGVLARAVATAGGHVQLAVVAGVHSPRAKHAWPTRLAERRGVTTLAPLLQIARPGYGEVKVTVTLDAPSRIDGADGAMITARLRRELLERMSVDRAGAGPAGFDFSQNRGRGALGVVQDQADT
jgi:hypothetical protein